MVWLLAIVGAGARTKTPPQQPAQTQTKTQPGVGAHKTGLYFALVGVPDVDQVPAHVLGFLATDPTLSNAHTHMVHTTCSVGRSLHSLAI